MRPHFSAVFVNFDKCRPEIADVAIVAVDQVGVDVRVKISISTLNIGPILHTYMQYSTAVCSQPEAAGHVISGRCI